MNPDRPMPPPPTPGAIPNLSTGPLPAPPTPPPPPPTPAPRRYDLDALRGFAMLLGIALHAAIPFVPYWREGDASGEFLFGFFEYVHGFRMPLFFLLSGFFTAMLWRRRGLRALVRHRFERIVLPLFLGVFTVLPAVVIGIIIGYVVSGEDVDTGDAVGQYDEEIQADPERAAIGDDDAGDTDQEFGFAHMWFLWFLLWMVAGFFVVARLIAWLARKRGRRRPIPRPVATATLIALPFLAFVPANAMIEPVFGPDTSEGLAPGGSVLAFYACFFAFGALAYDRSTGSDGPLMVRVGRGWPAHLAVSSFVLFPLGLWLVDENPTLSSVMQVGFAWSMSFALIGLFHRFLSEPRFRVRYLSDASYWMYLTHLPLVFVGQGIAARMGLHPVVGFVAITVLVTAAGLVTYRYLVRYTFIGELLNGRRTRVADEAQRASLASWAQARGS